MESTDTQPGVTDVVQRLREQWRKGIHHPVEWYLTQLSIPDGQKSVFLDLIYAEICVREEQGDPVSATEYCARFPGYSESIRNLFSVHRLLNEQGDSLIEQRPHDDFPPSGGNLGPFRLVRVLGTGSQAIVYLAEQTNLADRRVALKVSKFDSDEASILASLQHPNIIPILSVHECMDSGLTAICMPYFSAVSLQTLIARCAITPPSSSREFVDIVRGATSSVNVSELSPRGSFVYSCCHLMRQVADALAHAHDEGIHHHDLKPSNILVLDSGKPMVVDFNLAEEFSTPEASQLLGGTIQYMTPERLRAFLDDSLEVSSGPESDVYSFGATFYELITGSPPHSIDCAGKSLLEYASAHLTRIESSPVDDSVAPDCIGKVLSKCLEVAPEDRYQSFNEICRELDRCILRLRPKRPFILQFGRKAGFLTILALALSLVLVLFLKSTGKSPLEGYLAGVRLFKNNDYSAAIALFNKSIEQGNRDPLVYYWRARTAQEMGRTGDAIRDFDRCLSLDPTLCHAYLRRALCAPCKNPRSTKEDVLKAIGLARQSLPTRDLAHILLDSAKVFSNPCMRENTLADEVVDLVVESLERGISPKDVRSSYLLFPFTSDPRIAKYLESKF